MSHPLLFRNNAISTLTADITSGAEELEIAESDASKFPDPESWEYFIITAEDAETGVSEIMRCTERDGNVLYVERAQESTIASAFSAGAQVSMRLTAGMLEAIRDN